MIYRIRNILTNGVWIGEANSEAEAKSKLPWPGNQMEVLILVKGEKPKEENKKKRGSK